MSQNRIVSLTVGALLAIASVVPYHAIAQTPQDELRPQGQNPKGMHIYIWGGLKSHGEGQHDYPQFLADWSKILTNHGAVVDGACTIPQPRTSNTRMP
jgi:hypothetical protein